MRGWLPTSSWWVHWIDQTRALCHRQLENLVERCESRNHLLPHFALGLEAMKSWHLRSFSSSLSFTRFQPFWLRWSWKSFAHPHRLKFSVIASHLPLLKETNMCIITPKMIKLQRFYFENRENESTIHVILDAFKVLCWTIPSLLPSCNQTWQRKIYIPF